ncbi:ABC transporter permease [Amycolatopsis pigmentata]|uniref:ABC transporter permease n=1 Tax=Amycolatopsis pigmentata TaxID=450801 RepID=A0ABW5G6A8_9PSEU
MTEQISAAPPSASTRPGSARKRVSRRWIAAPVAIGLLVIASVTTDGFATWENAKAIVASVAVIGPVAIAATLIMVSGSLFSLSLGVTAATSGMLFLSLLDRGLLIAIVVTLVAGALVFAAQGWAIGAWGVNPVIITIGAGSLQAAVAAELSGGNNVLAPAGFPGLDLLSRNVLGLPMGVYLFAAVAAAVHGLLSRTSWGRGIYLVGQNRQAAYVAGLPVTAILTAAFAVAGVCVALAGLVQAASITSANLAAQGTLTFDATAAAVVGGNAVQGGRGSVPRTLAGVMIIATVTDLFLIRGYSTGMQLALKGLLVMVFVFLSAKSRAAR